VGRDDRGLRAAADASGDGRADGGRGLHAGHEAEPDPERQLLRLRRDRALSAAV
jgi:hypothetical protein